MPPEAPSKDPSREQRNPTRSPLRKTNREPDNLAFGLPRWFQVDASETEGLFSSWIEEIPAATGPPLHVHTRETEIFTMLRGALVFQLADDRFTAGVGETVVIPRGAPHTFHNPTNTTARALVALTPGGGDRFFRDVQAEALGPDDMARITEIAAEYGLQFVGPPIA